LKPSQIGSPHPADRDRTGREHDGYEPVSPGACALMASACTPPASSPRQRCINHAVAFDSALPFEGGRYDIDPEVRLAARPVAGMALMKM